MARKNIVIITQPLPNIKGGHVVLEKFIRILEPTSDRIYVLTAFYPQHEEISKKIKIINHSYHEHPKFNFTNILEYFVYQFRLSFSLLKYCSNYDVVLFHLGAMGLIIPLLTSKILNKKVLIIMTGSATESIKTIYRSKMGKIPFYITYYLAFVFANTNFFLANQVIVCSKSVIQEWNLSKYSSKIIIIDYHFLDFEKFCITQEFKKRNKIIGFVGRLSEEKGALNLLEVMPSILEHYPDWSFLFIGSGYLERVIKEESLNRGLNHRVKIINWIPQDQLPKYYNQMKILVLPSYTEGLPNVVIEAMACGTLVLANRVGSIPDIITDGETGFIMDDNSPCTIAKSIDQAINYQDHERMVKKAKYLIYKKFNYTTAVKNYEKLLHEWGEYN